MKMTIEQLHLILQEDAKRNAIRFKEAAEEGRIEDANWYAGKEMEANRILLLIEMP